MIFKYRLLQKISVYVVITLKIVIIFVAEFHKQLNSYSMKNKILELLKTKFPGVQDSVLGRIADKLAKTALTEDAATTAVEGVTIQSVIDSYADSRANEATTTAISNYEKKYGLKDGKQATPGEPKPGEPKPGDEISAIIANALKPLQEKLAAFESGQTITSRRSVLEAKLKEAKAPEVFTNQTLKFVDKMNFTDEEFEQYTQEVIDNAAKLAQDTVNAGLANQHQPFASVGGGGSKELIAQDIKQWADSKTTPAK
jgi:hypothetical protein